MLTSRLNAVNQEIVAFGLFVSYTYIYIYMNSPFGVCQSKLLYVNNFSVIALICRASSMEIKTHTKNTQLTVIIKI